MLSKHSKDNRKQISMISLDELVPQNHLVRKLDRALDFNFVYEELKKAIVEILGDHQ